VTKGRGGRTWDVDGNEYVDLICALLPVTLGYGDPDVDSAIRAQLDSGIVFSLGTELEVELAETLIEIIPCAEAVRYGKNGTDATSAAVRLARAFTGRDRIAVAGYHGWQDWYVGATVRKKGIPKAVQDLTHRFPYNNIDALHALFRQFPGEFAAVITEPAGAAVPKPGYLEALKDLTKANGALLVFDEIVTGFRLALGGGQEYFQVTPDLAAFGKGMANGMPLSAIVGRADVMAEMEEVFLSSTYGGEALSLAAAIATIRKMRREPVIQGLWKIGSRISAKAEAAIQAHGLGPVISLGGLDPWRLLTFRDHPNAPGALSKTFFIREMLAQGVLMMASHNVCYAHDETDIEHVGRAYDRVLGRLAEELRTPGLEQRLGCPAIRPVFSVR
jgi:glutamate-1-semialdehyde 2,1-aminomutase/spore coat polysaccharide biosynthesis protein SpsF